MEARVALPKGRLTRDTADLLRRVGWELDDYDDQARLYRLHSKRYTGLKGKILQEKDIPIQVAVGNYDLGICGLDWVLEQQVKYPSSNIVRLKNLGYGEGGLFAAASRKAWEDGRIKVRGDTVRLASEYPNLTEALAQRLRLKRFCVFPLWGAAEGYPPEDADIVLVARRDENEITARGLQPLGRITEFKACLIANRESLKTQDLAELLASFSGVNAAQVENRDKDIIPSNLSFITAIDGEGKDNIRLALPDGHQQSHVRKILDAAGIGIGEYPSAGGNRRPESNLEGFDVKVIRPQDMPLQVACGNFDLAITGRDWLTDHLYQFPTSPVQPMLDLKYGWVRIVAVVDNAVPAKDLAELKEYWRVQDRPVRVASEYTNIADNYARINQLGDYKVIPTWGATEAFLPEDADLLIENTETGSTIARHNLRIIETLFESTACVIGKPEMVVSAFKQGRVHNFIERLARGIEALA